MWMKTPKLVTAKEKAVHVIGVILLIFQLENTEFLASLGVMKTRRWLGYWEPFHWQVHEMNHQYGTEDNSQHSQLVLTLSTQSLKLNLANTILIKARKEVTNQIKVIQVAKKVIISAEAKSPVVVSGLKLGFRTTRALTADQPAKLLNPARRV